MQDKDLLWNEKSRKQLLETPVLKVMQTESISHSLRTTSVTRSDSLLSFFLQRNIIYI